MNIELTQIIPKLYIRCNASYNVGLGHFIRCLSLAQSIKSLFDITFVIQSCSFDIIETLEHNDFNLKSINQENDWLDDVESNSFVLIDTYDFPDETKYKIKQKCAALICIDDDCLNYKYADYIINHAPNANRELYPNIETKRLFLGLDYALLRAKFIQIAQGALINKSNEDIFICVGGSDKENITYQIVNALNSLEEPKILNVVFGSKSNKGQIDKVRSLTTKNKIKIYHNIEEDTIADLMLKSKIAIIPSSGILIEALVCRCNILTFYYTNNQKSFHDFLKENKIIKTIDAIDSELDSTLLLSKLCEIMSMDYVNHVPELIEQIKKSPENLRKSFLYIIENKK